MITGVLETTPPLNKNSLPNIWKISGKNKNSGSELAKFLAKIRTFAPKARKFGEIEPRLAICKGEMLQQALKLGEMAREARQKKIGF